MNKKLFIILSLVILLAGGVVWLQQFKQKQTNSQTTSQVESQRITASESSKPGTQDYPQHIETIPGNSDEVWYNIPELGVRMKLNKEFAMSLIYQYSHEVTAAKEEWDAVAFSTKELITIDRGCSPEEGRPLGSITKWKGNIQELAKTDDFFSARLDSIIQIGDYYYMWTGPHDACWDPKYDEEIAVVRNPEVYINIQNGLKNLQKIPLK